MIFAGSYFWCSLLFVDLVPYAVSVTAAPQRSPAKSVRRPSHRCTFRPCHAAEINLTRSGFHGRAAGNAEPRVVLLNFHRLIVSSGAVVPASRCSEVSVPLPCFVRGRAPFLHLGFVGLDAGTVDVHAAGL